MAGEIPQESHEGELRHARDLCEDIRHAAEMREIAERTLDLAQSAASKAINATMFDTLPFRFQVEIPADTEAYVTVDDEVVQQQPKSFLATEIRAISQHGVEFYDNDNARWLKIRGFGFEISPFLADESLDPIENLKRELDANDVSEEQQRSILQSRYRDLEDPRSPQE